MAYSNKYQPSKIQTERIGVFDKERVFTGTIDYIDPSNGYALVRPTGSTNVTQRLFCRLPQQGGLLGSCISAAPQAGSEVQFKLLNAHRGIIISCKPTNSSQQGFSQVRFFRSLFDSIGSPFSKLKNTLTSFLKDQKIAVGEQAINSGMEDQQPGDIYIGDKRGPGAFFGRLLQCIKASFLCYVQLDGSQDKITTVTVKSQLDTLSSSQIRDTKLDRYLKASDKYQGLGGIVKKAGKVLEKIFKIQNNGQKVQYDKPALHPLYRFQKFSGGAVQGTCCSVVAPIVSENQRPSVISYQKADYDGTLLNLCQGFTSIKTLRTSGVSQYPFPQGADKAAINKEIEKRTEDLNKIIKEYKDIALSQNGLYKILQLALLLRDRDTSGLLLQGINESNSNIDLGIDLLTPSYNEKLGLKDKAPKITGQQIEDYPNVTVEDALTGKKITRFDNNSIISQDPDGSVTIKDGWGSQITMSHGNIYISSALDTFIRPGRDLITMVPRHLSQTANGQVELASKQDIKLGAQGNLVMASAVNGQPGYTVLQNRSVVGYASEAGMVIRSNGNLSLTASQDMHIGINDKRRVNLGDSGANTGKGSVYIEGGKVRVESKEQLEISGSNIGIYSYRGQIGAGLEISSQNVTAIGKQVSLDTGTVNMGKSTTQYKVVLNTYAGRKEVSLSQGGSDRKLQIRGALQCEGSITTAGGIKAAGGIEATNYSVWTKETMTDIPGYLDKDGKYKESILSKFSAPLVGQSLSASFSPDLQPWYKDSYICNKQLSFFDSWSVNSMPQMSWQVTAYYTNKLLQPIQVASTGSSQEYTCSYPGKIAWGDNNKACKMITVGPDFNVIGADSDKAPLLRNAYKTNNTER